MIITKLQGGLGNQLFQYAAGLSLAQRLDTELVYDVSWYEGRKALGDTSRPYELGVFSVSGRKATSDEELAAQFVAEPRVFKRRLKYILHPKVPKLTAFWETGFQYNKDFSKIVDNTCIVGFWQSEMYFRSIADLIQRDFTIKSKPDTQNANLLEKIKQTTAVSLHVRRGDYVTNSDAGKFHGLTGVPFYEEAVKTIAKKVGDISIFVFSDDPEWCKQNLNFDYPITFIDHNAGPKAYEDLRLMSACHHHVLANSSFSWWGAWLNPRQDKIVVGPKRWFNDDSVDTSDVLPKSWIAL